ncbi:MAG TPA: FtsX-like permease family protein [Ktedonobacteraceae bacterium]|nr:FtsX-like permease family protein [Ktedonobacteraceae bacterium]
MKASMYFNYTSRSLLRGGQRTVLAIFCIAIGVMSIVALQLVGYMLQNSLTSNVRDANGGDISVSTQYAPIRESDLAFFNQLRDNGTITNYTTIEQVSAGLTSTTPSFQAFNVEAVDPTHYPLVTPPTFVSPSNGKLSDILANNRVVVTQGFIDRYAKKVGDNLDVYVKAINGTGRTLHVTIAGVIANSGGFSQVGNLLFVSNADYQAAAPSEPVVYSGINITTPDASHTTTATKAIKLQFPVAATQTVADVLSSQQATVDNLTLFMEIAGLIALLIGGVGIINTMQVLLSRRKLEIATLKTTGYRRLDLYILFGLEASLLGLAGGVIGSAAAIGVSSIVSFLLTNLSGSAVLFAINPWILVGGIAIGLGSALIFGLMPIVQAANIRPLNVVREITEHRSVGSTILTLALLVIFSLLFCGLAIIILQNNILTGVEVVYGAFAFLLVIGLLFSLIILIISKLPVPEHFNIPYLLLVLVGVLASVALYLVLPVFGIILLIVVLLATALAFMSTTWKVSMKMALRNLGRRRTRMTTTMVALFIGIFSIGLIVALGQGLLSQINVAFATGEYNMSAITTGTDSQNLQAQIKTIPGLSKATRDVLTQAVPVAINGVPLQQVQANITASHQQEALKFMGTIEGYNLSSTVPTLTMSSGRNLNASDAGTNNIVVIDQLTSSGSDGLNLKPGDTITYASLDGQTQKVAKIVGIYTGAISVSHVGMVLTSEELVNGLSPAKTGASAVTYMKVDTAKLNQGLDAIGRIAPNASIVNDADLGAGFAQQLNSFVDVLIAIASLSMIAGVIIIANSVALAMLERRREMGILKSVGYTSGTVLREVVIENGIIGAVGAFLAMLLALGGVTLAGHLLFNLSLSVAPWIVITLIVGAALLAILTAVSVSWQAVRVRPLEVLRYE